MAWISVDQKLIGRKLRKLYKAIGCSQNEAIGILISLWLWGLDNADLDGLIVSADRSDISGALREGMSPDIDAGEAVDRMIDTGWIDEVEDRLYLHDWEDWRAYYSRYIREKEKNAERVRKHRERKAEAKLMSDGTGNASEKPPAQKPEKESKYGKEFEEFWSVYPRKADKGQAYKKYQARRKDGYSPEELLQAAKNYRSQCVKQRTEQQYIKHAKTFLGETAPFTEFLHKQQGGQTSTNKFDPSVNPFR